MRKLFSIMVAASLAMTLALFLANCGGSDNGAQCSGPQDCPQGQYCDLTTKTCKTQCEPQCDGKCGGDDGCGGTCPNTCPAGQICNTTTNQCETCTPDCTGRECGPDPNCGEICGECDTGEQCVDGQCVTCQKDCTNRECGPDPVCGESCGTCPSGEHCEDGTCVAGASVPGDPCPGGDEDCPDEWPTCLSGSNFTYCSKVCNTDTDCGGDNCCLEISGGQKACFDPSQCPGTGTLGDPCPYGDVHADAVNCDENHQCLGLDPTDQNAQACSVDNDCTDTDPAYNPECVNGKCGGSFCALPCPNGDANQCPEGSQGATIGSGECFCLPNPVAQDCTDPVNNVGCQQGERCVPVGGSALDCVPEGSAGPGETCDSNNPCQAGLLCAGGGSSYTCLKLCDTSKQNGGDEDCPTDYSCFGITGIERWGVCDYTPTCDITDSNACADTDGYACVPWQQDCSEYRCIFNSNAQAGDSCQYINSCAPGLICEGDQSSTCKEVCDPTNASCPGGTSCQAPAGLCDPVPTAWGVCK